MAVRLSALRAGRPLVDPKAIVQLEGLDQLKNLMTLLVIEPASFRVVA
jgi:hypothetical protein